MITPEVSCFCLCILLPFSTIMWYLLQQTKPRHFHNIQQSDNDLGKLNDSFSVRPNLCESLTLLRGMLTGWTLLFFCCPVDECMMVLMSFTHFICVKDQVTNFGCQELRPSILELLLIPNKYTQAAWVGKHNSVFYICLLNGFFPW